MLQNIWYILRRKTMPVLILISGSQRCLPICADLPSSMLWGQYPLIKHGWIYGKRQTERAELHLWRKRDIQKCCEHQAHRKGMRVSRICAWNTSRLAYDGSGVVTRDWENHSLCTFQTGKRYHCDLSASCNIGARYFIRELLKPLPATERSLLEAKVPSVKRRTSCVYADLKKLHSEMELLKAV